MFLNKNFIDGSSISFLSTIDFSQFWFMYFVHCCVQVKKLLSERIEQDRKLHKQEEEVKKLEGRLQTVVQDKTRAEGRVGALERELGASTRAGDILKQKVSTQRGKYSNKKWVHRGENTQTKSEYTEG